MSDTEEGGSFDREAEKEKLREQLRREEENRRSTQHMSELLLKGATMTNKHCETCGDPLFRYEGREFCPTCARDGSEAGEGGGATAGAETGPEQTGAAEAGEGDARPTEVDRVPAGSGTDGMETPDVSPGESVMPAPTRDDVPEDVEAARAALVRKLGSLARQAEATEDVGRSRELLAAAREAAEALAAIDAVRR